MDYLQLAIQIGTLLSVVIGFTGLLFAINTYRREMNAQVIMKYAERFEQLMNLLPDKFFITGFREEKLPPESDKLRLAILKYLNFCAEEFYLAHHGYLSKKVWTGWEYDMKRALRSPLIKREWKILKEHFVLNSGFTDLVEQELSQIKLPTKK
jgi:hypothetical protein